MSPLLLIVIIILLFSAYGSAPIWPYAANWGYAPFGGFATVLIIILLLKIAGVI